MNHKTRLAPAPDKPRAERSLSQILEILHNTRLNSAVDRVGSIREQFLLVFTLLQREEILHSDAKTLCTGLHQELSKIVWNLEEWQIRARS